MNHLGVFAKYWQAGAVKTRLAASIGSENAASLYREFVQQTLGRHAQIGGSRSVWIWPPEKSSEFSHVRGDNWSIEHQADGDLGQKMLDFFQRTLSGNTTSEGPPKSVLIGTDSPDLPTELIENAFHLLDQNACVLGPSQDGGYYLIGMNQLIPSVFARIQWSSPQVFRQTVARLDEAGVQWAQLPEWNDIDELDDLQQLQGKLVDLAEPSGFDQQLLAAIQEFGTPVK